jgi:predicted transcriptional regulator
MYYSGSDTFMHPKALGPLESAVMEVIWSYGESDVNGVRARLTVPLAYTTVMTTLSRLFHKGLLRRRQFGRAFLYSQSISKEEKLQNDLAAYLAFLLHNSETMRGTLISQLGEVVAHADGTLLGQLERRIKAKRRAIAATRSPGGS